MPGISSVSTNTDKHSSCPHWSTVIKICLPAPQSLPIVENLLYVTLPVLLTPIFKSILKHFSINSKVASFKRKKKEEKAEEEEEEEVETTMCPVAQCGVRWHYPNTQQRPKTGFRAEQILVNYLYLELWWPRLNQLLGNIRIKSGRRYVKSLLSLWKKFGF